MLPGIMNVRAYRSVDPAVQAWQDGTPTVLFKGDCIEILRSIPDESVNLIVTSPPYCMGKEYEDSYSIEDFVATHQRVLPDIVRVVKPGGSICWQVGYHVADKCAYPLDYAVFEILSKYKEFSLRNRIIWTFGHGLHGRRRFSGRHEIVLWFTKGDHYYFDLDAVRVPQKYPGKRHYKGKQKGEFSGNPKGKNPSDVWEIPNVKANHIEKIGHPCQFPVGLAERCVRALCPKTGVVLDPFMGSASTGVAAIANKRRFLGAETNDKYFQIAHKRLVMAYGKKVPYRPADLPIYAPNEREAVARRPGHFVEVSL
jgi:adenine-specific DNA-methyltransferase